MGQRESRNSRANRIAHRFFELGILIKGIDGAFEFVGGLLLAFLSPAAINRLVFFLVEDELKEDPAALASNLLLHITRSAIKVKVSASVFLIIHGAVKLALVIGLATHRLWSYPLAILVFTGFTIYQLYQLSQQYSLFMVTVTVLDVMVIILVIAEYRHMKGKLNHRGTETLS